MAVNDFEDWLCKELTSLDIDNDVYGSYITGILQDTDSEEKKDVLSEVLGSLGVENSEELCSNVLKKWDTFQLGKPQIVTPNDSSKNIGDIFAAHTPASSNKLSSLKHVSDTNGGMSDLKRVVLARYGEVNDDEDSEDIVPADSNQVARCNTVDSALEIMKNTNAENIAQAEKMERQKRKEEAVKKKEQDKINRENQKTKKAERKDKEKKRTQKKERGR